MMNVPPMPLKKLIQAYEMAKELIERHDFHARIAGIKNGKCSKCGAKLPIII